jgi:uncharacterized membrane-anchored protein YitT (DUF2179 family)
MRATDYIASRIARLFPVMAFALLIALPVFNFYALSIGEHYMIRSEIFSTISNLFFVPYFEAAPAR